MPVLLGIDTGGTYTDAVLFDEDEGVVATAKALTTRHDLAVGIGNALDAVLADHDVRPQDIALVSLSTTLATNAVVEGQGGRVCLVLIGFDERALARADLAQALKDDPVIVLAGGHDAHGDRVADLDRARLEAELGALKGKVSGYAVAAQFAVRNPEHEIAARDTILEITGRPVTCSHELSSKLDGPRRGLTSVLNARLINLIHHLISAASDLFETRGIDAPLMVVRGDGALISADMAMVKPIETILSGPAASLVGAAHLTGAADAIVSDIGGTTTDFAALTAGRPRLDPNGATVGGWRTMVEAVAMNTIGLGGDSEVQFAVDGLETELVLGPRRLVPLSLFALDHRDLVHETLERQLGKSRTDEHDGRFAILVGRANAHMSALGSSEQSLIDQLADGPLSLDRLIKSRVQAGTVNRLAAQGLVMISGLTPSDAAHVLGLHGGWDKEAALQGAELFARQRGNKGQAIAEDAKTLSRWIVDTLIGMSAETLLAACLKRDGLTAKGLARQLLTATATQSDTHLTQIDAGLRVPVIGLGASAPTYYPHVAEKLGTDALIPEHAGVANAVGAVVGRIRVIAEASISQPEQGRYRVYSSQAPRDFAKLDDAAGFAETILRDEARAGALDAGAGDIEIRINRDDKTAVIEGKEQLIETLIRATASGRPQITG